MKNELNNVIENLPDISSRIQLNFVPDNNKVCFNIYPNPGSGIFNVQSTRKLNSIPVELNVVDICGRQVYTSNFNTEKTKIDLSAFEAGVYCVTIRYFDKTEKSKIVLVK